MSTTALGPRRAGLAASYVRAERRKAQRGVRLGRGGAVECRLVESGQGGLKGFRGRMHEEEGRRVGADAQGTSRQGAGACWGLRRWH